MSALATPKSPASENVDPMLARWEAARRCRCDGGETHGHCFRCKRKLAEGEDWCEACDLKARSRHCSGCGGSYVVSKGGGEKAPSDFRGTGVCSVACRDRLFNGSLVESGLTLRGLEKTFENFIPQTAVRKRQLQKLTAWMDGPRKVGVFLRGPVGTGKTHVACALMRALCQRGLDGRFIKCCAFTLRCQAVYNHDEEPATIVNELLRGQFLVLDDIGVEKVTEFVREVLVYLVDEILTRKKVLIATSNRTLDELQSIDPRFSDRIVELCDQYEFSGSSYRPRISQVRATQQGGTETADDTISFALPQGSHAGNGTGRRRVTMTEAERHAGAAEIRRARAADRAKMLVPPF